MLLSSTKRKSYINNSSSSAPFGKQPTARRIKRDQCQVDKSKLRLPAQQPTDYILQRLINP